MQISTKGLFKGVIEAMGDDDHYGYGYTLLELQLHLEELFDRIEKKDMAVIADFKECYFIEKD